jgi:hypothetical protein
MSRDEALQMVKRRLETRGAFAAVFKSQLPRDGDHDVPGERRSARDSSAHRGSRAQSHNDRLRPATDKVGTLGDIEGEVLNPYSMLQVLTF